MTLILRLIAAALGLFLLAAEAVGQETRVAAAADADVIAVYSQHVEKRLLRAHFDRANAKVSLAPFGPPGVETFAVAPDGAFVVYSATDAPAAGMTMTTHSRLEGWRSVVLWGAASLLVAAVAVSFVMWGLNGPAYLIDLIAAYCL